MLGRQTIGRASFQRLRHGRAVVPGPQPADAAKHRAACQRGLQADLGRQGPHDQGAERRPAAEDHAERRHHPPAHVGRRGVLHQGLGPDTVDDQREARDQQAAERDPEMAGGDESQQGRGHDQHVGDDQVGHALDRRSLRHPQPARHGAKPGRRGEPGEPLRPAREHRVRKPGQEFDEGARAERGDRQQRQHRPDPGMARRIGIAVAGVAENRAARRRAVGRRQPDEDERHQEGDVAQGVCQEGEGDAAMGDREAGRRRADEPRAVEDDRIDRDRRRQVLALDKARDQRQPRRLVERVGDAQRHRQREQALDGDGVGIDKGRDGARLDHRDDLGEDDDAQALEPVRQRPGQRAEDDGRKQIGEGDQPKPGPGFGELPGEPADRHALQPRADQRDRVADREGAIVALSQRRRDAPKSGQLVSLRCHSW